jgi:hypothetical protein
LNTDSTHTNAAVTTATPAAEMPDMMLITLCDLRENKYRRAICHAKEKFEFLLILFEKQNYAKKLDYKNNAKLMAIK